MPTQDLGLSVCTTANALAANVVRPHRPRCGHIPLVPPAPDTAEKLSLYHRLAMQAQKAGHPMRVEANSELLSLVASLTGPRGDSVEDCAAELTTLEARMRLLAGVIQRNARDLQQRSSDDARRQGGSARERMHARMHSDLAALRAAKQAASASGNAVRVPPGTAPPSAAEADVPTAEAVAAVNTAAVAETEPTAATVSATEDVTAADATPAAAVAAADAATGDAAATDAVTDAAPIAEEVPAAGPVTEAEEGIPAADTAEADKATVPEEVTPAPSTDVKTATAEEAAPKEVTATDAAPVAAVAVVDSVAVPEEAAPAADAVTAEAVTGDASAAAEVTAVEQVPGVDTADEKECEHSTEPDVAVDEGDVQHSASATEEVAPTDAPTTEDVPATDAAPIAAEVSAAGSVTAEEGTPAEEEMAPEEVTTDTAPAAVTAAATAAEAEEVAPADASIAEEITAVDASMPDATAEEATADAVPVAAEVADSVSASVEASAADVGKTDPVEEVTEDATAEEVPAVVTAEDAADAVEEKSEQSVRPLLAEANAVAEDTAPDSSSVSDAPNPTPAADESPKSAEPANVAVVGVDGTPSQIDEAAHPEPESARESQLPEVPHPETSPELSHGSSQDRTQVNEEGTSLPAAAVPDVVDSARDETAEPEADHVSLPGADTALEPQPALAPQAPENVPSQGEEPEPEPEEEEPAVAPQATGEGESSCASEVGAMVVLHELEAPQLTEGRADASVASQDVAKSLSGLQQEHGRKQVLSDKGTASVSSLQLSTSTPLPSHPRAPSERVEIFSITTDPESGRDHETLSGVRVHAPAAPQASELTSPVVPHKLRDVVSPELEESSEPISPETSASEPGVELEQKVEMLIRKNSELASKQLSFDGSTM